MSNVQATLENSNLSLSIDVSSHTYQGHHGYCNSVTVVHQFAPGKFLFSAYKSSKVLAPIIQLGDIMSVTDQPQTSNTVFFKNIYI